MQATGMMAKTDRMLRKTIKSNFSRLDVILTEAKRVLGEAIAEWVVTWDSEPIEAKLVMLLSKRESRPWCTCLKADRVHG